MISHHPSENKRGFTLIELLLVIAIITILSTLSVAFYSRFLTQNATLNNVDQVVADIRKAQIYAISGHRNSNWGVNYANSEIILYSGPNYAGRTQALDEKFSVNPNITISGLNDINFAKSTGISSAATITITANNTTKTVTVNSLGVVSR